MARVTIHIGGRERLEPAISKATPMGLLGTEAIVHLGPASLTGSATAMRALADAYDADPDAFTQRQRAELLNPEEEGP